MYKRGGDQEEPSQREGTHQHVYELKTISDCYLKKRSEKFFLKLKAETSIDKQYIHSKYKFR